VVMLRNILVLLVLLALPQQALAWSAGSYEVAARRLCSDFNCACHDRVVVASNVPDLKFKDMPAHHCYKTAFDYSQYAPGSWVKPAVNDCPTFDKVSVWLGVAEEDSGCERWYDFGVALHYFLDGKEFWNTVVAANRTCVKEYESAVNDYLLYGGGNWTTCSCGICVSNEDFVDWLAEFEERVKPLISSKRYEKPTVVLVANEFDGNASDWLGYYLKDMKADVIRVTPSELAKRKDRAFIIIVGGQNAPGIGSLVGGVLTEEDKAAVLNAVFTGVVMKKTNLWVTGQTVYFVAGYGVGETADALWKSRDQILATAAELAAKEESPECSSNEDCGSSYHGPWICRNRENAARVLYKPYCERGVCVQRAQKPSNRDCKSNEVCFSFEGCVSNRTLPVVESVHAPLFYTWLSSERAVAIKGRGVKLVLYARSYLNETTECEYYDSDDGWTSMGNPSVNGSVEALLNVSSDTIGQSILAQRIRCSNATSDEEESIPLYYAEHNFTLNIIPPPIAFTFTLTPQNITLSDCFDRRNVTLRVENLCGHNITCSYSVGGTVGAVSIRKPGDYINVTNRRWVWSIENSTPGYLSYYSGSDFPSTSYNVTDEEGNVTTKYVSQATVDAYATLPKNFTYYNVTTILNETSSYAWYYDPWVDNILFVDSGECQLNRIPVTVTCTDEYSQLTTLKKNITLKYPALIANDKSY
ncbi:MAG: hypothetical protein V1744_03065, partial [Candidatus Altiarchaeota archaeon]